MLWFTVRSTELRGVSEKFTLRRAVSAAVFCISLGVGSANAGIIDTPPPSFSDGKAAEVVGLVPTVIKNNELETVLICSNFSTDPVNVGFEVFDRNGDVANSIAADNGVTLGLPVGATTTIGTSGTGVLHEDERISGLPQIANGSGRVLSTASDVNCIALHVDDLHRIEDPALSDEQPPTLVMAAVWICGNSRVEPMEQCDGGGAEWSLGSGCRPDCTAVACGDPDDSAAIFATDANIVLQVAVGLIGCDSCVCDVDSNGRVTAADALRILSFSVGLPVSLDCGTCR